RSATVGSKAATRSGSGTRPRQARIQRLRMRPSLRRMDGRGTVEIEGPGFVVRALAGTREPVPALLEARHHLIERGAAALLPVAGQQIAQITPGLLAAGERPEHEKLQVGDGG